MRYESKLVNPMGTSRSQLFYNATMRLRQGCIKQGAVELKMQRVSECLPGSAAAETHNCGFFRLDAVYEFYFFDWAVHTSTVAGV